MSAVTQLALLCIVAAYAAFLVMSWSSGSPKLPELVVVGAVCSDVLARVPHGTKLLLDTSNPGVVEQRWGGVSNNIAVAASIAAQATMQHAGAAPDLEWLVLVSQVGDDTAGRAYIADSAASLNMRGVRRLAGERTAVYCAVYDGDGELVTAIADTAITSRLSSTIVEEHQHDIQASKLVAFDGNLDASLMAELCSLAARYQVPVWFEPTSVPKAARIVEHNAIANITIISPDWRELLSISHALAGHDQPPPPIASDYTFDRARYSFDVAEHLPHVAQVMRLAPALQTVVLTLGAHGVLLASRNKSAEPRCSISLQHFNAPKANVISVNGAGDSLVGCATRALVAGSSLQQSVHVGMLCANAIIENRFTADRVRALLLEYPTPSVTKLPPLACT